MTTARERTAQSAAEQLAYAGSTLRECPALVGFDGFVDSIIELVDQRASMAPSDYRGIATIEAFAARCAAAAGKSTNVEIVVKEDRFGGNGPLMAGGLARLGLATTYVGAVGREDDHASLHPLYHELEARCRASGGRVLPVAPPAHTHALEFHDGKIMLGDPRNVQRVTWGLLEQRLGGAGLASLIGGARLLAVVNWVMMAGVQGILDALEAGPLAAHPGTPPRVFIDLCDPAKRTDADIRTVLGTLSRLNARAPVTLGLNLAEAERIDSVAGARAFVPDEPRVGEPIRRAAERLVRVLGLSCVVIHPREGAGGADSGGASGWFDGPLVRRPRISTGAGDHFNAGFALAQVLGLPLDSCLAVGCAESGVYVRDGESPTLERLVEFLRSMPAPER
jgi:sugar/nucleoside kinase (ribokinase family)